MNIVIVGDVIKVEYWSTKFVSNVFVKDVLLGEYAGGEQFAVNDKVNFIVDIIPLDGITITGVPSVSFGSPWDPTELSFKGVEDGIWRLQAGGSLYDYSGAPKPTEFVPATTGEVIQPIKAITPYNRLYLLDGEALEAFADEPLATYMPSENAPIIITYGDFVTGLLQLPYQIPEEYLNPDVNIIVGDYVTDILAPILNSDLVKIKLAEFPVMKADSNILDLIATTYELYLPFIDSPTELKPNEIYGEMISVFMFVDLYSGLATINVYSDIESAPIYTFQDNIAREIQTKLKEYKANDSIYGALGAGLLENDFLIPYIKTTREVLEKGTGVNLVKDSGVLGDVLGFVTVEYSEIGFAKTLNDYNELNLILSSGVIIK